MRLDDAHEGFFGVFWLADGKRGDAHDVCWRLWVRDESVKVSNIHDLQAVNFGDHVTVRQEKGNRDHSCKPPGLTVVEPDDEEKFDSHRPMEVILVNVRHE